MIQDGDKLAGTKHCRDSPYPQLLCIYRDDASKIRGHANRRYPWMRPVFLFFPLHSNEPLQLEIGLTSCAGQRRLRSACADAHADLSRHWPN